MRNTFIISTLLALEIVDGRTIRGAKNDKRGSGFRGAVRKCNHMFVDLEECLRTEASDCRSCCRQLHKDYFNCLYENEDLEKERGCGVLEAEERNVVTTSSNENSSSFGTGLFSKVCSEGSPGTNVLVSPLSVYRGIELLEDGATASSNNRDELDRLLGPLELREQVNDLRDFDTGGDVQLKIATSVWSDSLTDEFMTHANEFHGADTFDLPQKYNEVDLWIKEKTDGMITELMGDGDLDPLTRALLIDAVYFKGTWRIEFDPDENSKGIFVYGDESEDGNVTFMKASRIMEASTSPSLGNARFVLLDYKGNEFAAAFVLPATPDDKSIDDVVTGLNSQSISDLVDEATEIPVELKLPRFKLEFGPLSLKPSLMNMGMLEAFGDSVGKFNRMSYDKDLYVEDVMHGACIEINEEGTEAAAATAIVMNDRSVRDESMNLVFNRPFVVVIFQRSTGIPLFIGRVERPEFT